MLHLGYGGAEQAVIAQANLLDRKIQCRDNKFL